MNEKQWRRTAAVKHDVNPREYVGFFFIQHQNKILSKTNFVTLNPWKIK